MATTGREQRLRILHLEDDPNDAELIQSALESDGLNVAIERVMTADEFVRTLAQDFDLILSDYALPGFDGLSALRIARQSTPEVPFIMVSGQIGEEAAVESVRSGATDYVLKQHLSRLGPSVRRVLAEADERRKRRQAEEALRQSEARLRQAQKMEAIGRLAGGVAHDFNNLLTAILGYSQLLEKRLSSDAEARLDLEEIIRAADRASSLTRQLLAFSRQQVLRPCVLDLNTLIMEMGKMLQRLIGEDIDILTCPGPDLGCVKADPGQLGQVILNLAVNARDAMPEGGKLTIETTNVEFDEPSVQPLCKVTPGRYIMLAVSDTGCGMDDETLSRIFEPFFTTKEVGRGTGLGLSTVHGIVEQSEGHIEVYSEVGRGSTFKIYLPRVEEMPGTGERSRPAVSRSYGPETVLLVEDDIAVRTLVKRTLEFHGYAVIEAHDGEEGLAFCTQSEVIIDLLLTDIVMPKMSGPELVKRLATLSPHIKVLYMSGYTDQAIVHQGVLDPGMAFLQKPFTSSALLQRVREVLDEPRHAAA